MTKLKDPQSRKFHLSSNTIMLLITIVLFCVLYGAGCVMYAGATIFDLALPRIAAGVEMTRADFAAMGEGGLCLGCKPCHWPNCPFGR